MILFKCSIPGRAGILKNNKQIFRNRSTGKVFIKSSDRYSKWAHDAGIHLALSAKNMVTIKVPVNMKAIFYFDNHKSEADLSNLYQGIEDLLQKAGIIENDKLIYSHDGSRKIFGQEPGIDIELTEYEEKI